MHRPTFCTFLSASPMRAFYPALGQPLQRRSTRNTPRSLHKIGHKQRTKATRFSANGFGSFPILLSPGIRFRGWGCYSVLPAGRVKVKRHHLPISLSALIWPPDRVISTLQICSPRAAAAGVQAAGAVLPYKSAQTQRAGHPAQCRRRCSRWSPAPCRFPAGYQT